MSPRHLLSVGSRADGQEVGSICRCKADPPQLHGPFIVRTRKVEGKTVTRVLTPEQLADYRPLMDNAKRLRDLVTQLQDLILEVLDSDDRWRTR